MTPSAAPMMVGLSTRVQPMTVAQMAVRQTRGVVTTEALTKALRMLEVMMDQVLEGPRIAALQMMA